MILYFARIILKYKSLCDILKVGVSLKDYIPQPKHVFELENLETRIPSSRACGRGDLRLNQAPKHTLTPKPNTWISIVIIMNYLPMLVSYEQVTQLIY